MSGSSGGPVVVGSRVRVRRLSGVGGFAGALGEVVEPADEDGGGLVYVRLDRPVLASVPVTWFFVDELDVVG